MAQHVRPARVRPDTTRRDEKADAVSHERVTTDDTDDWLKEIDEALAENIEHAATFWASWVQRGGE